MDISGVELGIGDWGLEIGGWGLVSISLVLPFPPTDI